MKKSFQSITRVLTLKKFIHLIGIIDTETLYGLHHHMLASANLAFGIGGRAGMIPSGEISRQHDWETATSAGNAYVRSAEFRRIFSERIAARTDSAKNGPALGSYLSGMIAPSLRALGFECRIFEGQDALPAMRPILIARRIEDASLPTVLFYGHGDVAPPCDGAWSEGLDPWVLTLRDGRFWGRGVADNKGQHSVNIAAIERVLSGRDRLGLNAIFLMEMSEEVGSPGLTEFCDRHADLLRADILIASDGPRWRDYHPTLFLGARGFEQVELSVDLRKGAFHSGNFGGVLSNPGTILVNAIATIVDERGRILVPELDTPQSALANDSIFDGLEMQPGIDVDWGDPGATPTQRLLNRNQFEIIALELGNAEKPAYAVQPSARAICHLTHIEGTDTVDLTCILRRHLDAAGFHQVAVHHGPLSMPATRMSPCDPVVLWVADTVSRAANAEVDILPNFGGALPNWIFRHNLEMRTIWIPHSLRSSNQHSANENVPLSCLAQGMDIMAALLTAIGDNPDKIREGKER